MVSPSVSGTMDYALAHKVIHCHWQQAYEVNCLFGAEMYILLLYKSLQDEMQCDAMRCDALSLRCILPYSYIQSVAPYGGSPMLLRSS
jgi:hypothetical protein